MSSPKRSERLHSDAIQCLIARDFSPSEKLPVSEKYHSSAYSVEVKNEWSYTPFSHMPSCRSLHFVAYIREVHISNSGYPD